MRKSPKLLLRFALALSLAAALVSGAVHAQTKASITAEPDGAPHNAKLPPVTWHNPAAKLKLILVGDSTVQESSGWGPGFEAQLKPDIECINLARGGRSSKSFRDEGRWAQALALKPDYLILGFSHNDIHPDKPDRYSTPEAFRANITRFVQEAKQNGTRPILMTSMALRKWDKQGKFLDTPQLMPYEQITREVAEQEKIPLVDIVKSTTAFYIQSGKTAIDADSPVRDGKIDNAHLNHQGAMAIGALVAQQVKSDVPALAPYIR